MKYSQETHINNVVASIRTRVEAPRRSEKLDKDTVEAIDIVHHGLVFTRHERGMELWRSALWQRRVEPEAEESLRAMLVYLLAAVARGELEEVSKICDCLHEIMPPQDTLQPLMAGDQTR
jgi:hypothetical protein